MEPREVGEDAGGGDDKERTAFLRDTLVETLHGLLELGEELQKEEDMPGIVRAPIRGEGRNLDIQAISNRMSVILPKPFSQRLGPQRSFGRAPHVDQSQIGGSLSNVVEMGKVVLRYLNASVACG